MSRKLLVGNLPQSVTETTLSSRFSTYGQVKSIQLITDPGTGHFSGFACIRMAQHLDAQTALRSLNGFDFEGSPMRVERWPTTARQGYLLGGSG